MRIRILSILAIATLIISFASLTALAGTLDGMKFTGETGKIGKKSSEKDEVSFENGQFTSDGCQEYGFGSGTYETTVEGDTTHFVADTYSKKTGRITWVGTVTGDKLNATYLWYKKGKYSEPKQIKWFKGDMKK